MTILNIKTPLLKHQLPVCFHRGLYNRQSQKFSSMNLNTSNMEPTIKKIRTDVQKRTIFTNMDDERDCLQIITALDTVINKYTYLKYPKMPYILLREIGEYSTGSIVKCPGKECNYDSNEDDDLNEDDDSNEDDDLNECDGWIHILNGDNFGQNGVLYGHTYGVWNNNLSYAYQFFNYECDDQKCQKITNLFKCNDANCDSIITMNEDEPYPNYVCENAVRLVPKCRAIYCKKCWNSNGTKCTCCGAFFCFSCGQCPDCVV